MKVTFLINFHTVWGQKIAIVGSIPELGDWESALAKEMNYVGEGNWCLELELPSDLPDLEYRYVLNGNDKQLFEEWEKNHRVTFESQATHYTLYDYWQTRPANLAFYSSAFTQSLFAHPNTTTDRKGESSRKIIIKLLAPRVEKQQCIAITGNQACLGDWHPDRALFLNCHQAPEWMIELDADALTFPMEYKFLVCDSSTRQPLYWEEQENRVLNPLGQEVGETLLISGLSFRDNLPPWRCAGSVIPLFSLRSEESFGVGDLGDLHKLVDWARTTHQRIIQLLPVNDTTMSHTQADSYPYSAISIYALHPMYISLSRMGMLHDEGKRHYFEQMQRVLNDKEEIDYEQVVRLKEEYCRCYFEQEQEHLTNDPHFHLFIQQNESWLMPYAAYCYLRDKYHTSDFADWQSHSMYDEHEVRHLCSPHGEAYPSLLFSYFRQYILHLQFKGASDYARQHGIVLKGDLPIGVNRTSIEAWTEPACFNMNGQAGAPPDDFSANGQNWSFPTYNWEVMEKTDFRWWKKRFHKLSDYFDCFRIDHILGFFRIWEIPHDYVQGLCGHFNPALPLTTDEIEQAGFCFNQARFTTPHIHEQHLYELFGEQADDIRQSHLAQSSSHHFVLKPFCDTQRKIEKLFEGMHNEASIRVKNGLFAIANEVLFLEDPYEKGTFHPRIAASGSYLYQELCTDDKYAFDQLYWNFFYHRHNSFWKKQALNRLTPLVNSTNMLVCGEDLGMIPESVPDVMAKLQLLSLEIERMPKSPHEEFATLGSLPYLSVCTTSTHDMSPLRCWWREDWDKTQRYYNTILQQERDAPAELPAHLATRIVENHLNAPSMLVIIPLQDWFAMDDTLKRADADAERINVPANPYHYWCYRMHLTLEKLMQADGLNQTISSLITGSGRG